MIELSNVSYLYSSGFRLENVSLSLKKGEVLTIVGPNGAGKSTLLKLTAGQLIPTEGSVFISDRSLAKMTRGQIAKHLAYLSQSGLQSDLTVEDVVLHGRFPHKAFPYQYGKEDRALAAKAMEKMGLLPFSRRSLSTLSGGEKQKTMIAMALCQNSNSLLLDEPTAFLDPGGRISLMETLRGLSEEGKSILCVLHDLTLALRFSHRIAVMDTGRLLSLATPDETLASGILSRVFGVDLGRSDDGFYYYKNRND